MKIQDKFKQTAFELLRFAVTKLPKEVEEALEKAFKNEVTETGKMQLKAILENIKLAEEGTTPMCQDTGIMIFFLKVGKKFLAETPELVDSLAEVTRRATEEVPLRPNAVHPITRKNSGDNTGVNIPYVDVQFIPEDYVELTVFPKGGGSENMSAMIMLTPDKGLLGIKKFVVDTVINAGGKPCPPIIVGLGIGGSSDLALKLAKKALLRPINKRHSEPEIAKLEDELLEAVNNTGIGPMGLGGKHTALGVNAEYAYCHTASFPVAVNIQCWAARRATARIHEDGRVEHLTHGR